MYGRGIVFGGMQIDGIRVVSLDIGRVAPVRRKTLEIAGRPGGISRGYELGVRTLTVIVDFEAPSKREWLEKLDDLMGVLIQKKPQSLEFEHEPNRMYMVEFEGEIDTEEINIYGQVTLNFICVDPYVYGDSNIDHFNNGVAQIMNSGHAEAVPVYEIDVLEDITHLDIISDKSYFRIGEPAPINEPVYQRQTLILNDTMKTMIGWSDAIDVDNGYVTGTMVATQAGFEASSFGAAMQPPEFQGPSKVRTLPEPIQNFRIDIPIQLLNVSRETGMIEIYLLDAFSNTVAKIGFEDVWPTIKKNQGKFQLGNMESRKVQHYVSADYAPAWNNFDGMLRIHRDGNRIRPYFAQIKTDGRHDWVSSAYVYTDKLEEYMNEITQVQVAIRKWPGDAYDEAKMRIGGIKVWRLNSPPEGVPIMAKAGDKIIIDAIEGSVMINGEIREDLKDHFSDYFDLPKGQTTLVIQPDDKVSGKVITRERNL